jgi:hypothetical protein
MLRSSRYSGLNSCVLVRNSPELDFVWRARGRRPGEYWERVAETGVDSVDPRRELDGDRGCRKRNGTVVVDEARNVSKDGLGGLLGCSSYGDPGRDSGKPGSSSTAKSEDAKAVSSSNGRSLADTVDKSPTLSVSVW